MKFSPNKPVETTTARVVVDAGLKPGEYRFQLVVVNKDGKSSKPKEVIVTIRAT